MASTYTGAAGPSLAAGPTGARPGSGSLQAVLWDMDGTIVDTEPYWIRAETALVESFGGRWSSAEAEALVGQALTHSASILQTAGVTLSVREIIDRLTGEVINQVRQEVPWRPGARELLQELRDEQIPCALVTMSESPLAREVVAALPAGTFQHLVTGEMVAKGKPHPEAYEHAVALLARTIPGLDKSRIVAIEDSLPGVTAAMAAGVVTLGVPHFLPIPAHPQRTDWPTLANRSVQDLSGLLTGAGRTEQAQLQ